MSGQVVVKEKAEFRPSQAPKGSGGFLAEFLKRKYDGFVLDGFEQWVELALQHAVEAKTAARYLLLPLRKYGVFINLDHVEAVEIIERFGEPAVRIVLLTKEVIVSKNGVEIESLDVYTG